MLLFCLVQSSADTIPMERNLSTREVLLKLLRALELRQYSEDDMTLVVGASSTFEGVVVPPNTKLDSVPHLFKADKVQCPPYH